IQIILLDVKSGGARLTKGQQAIAQAIKEGKVRFETLRIDFEGIVTKFRYFFHTLELP
ncbi:hypothetical protein MXE30_08315, partial [Acinetobacter baumannii]|nr:hypothetical protein [Acinetobacter baumannii]